MSIGLGLGLGLTGARGVAATVALSTPTFARQNTTITNSLGADGYTWAQAFPIISDQYGKLIMSAQDSATGNHAFVISNDNGTTWADNTGATGNGGVGSTEGFIQRSALAYNAVDDTLWCLHVTTVGGNGGAFLRRYTFTRDGSNNILTIVRDLSASCVLEDDVNALAEKPVLHWLNDAIYGTHGALVATWTMTDAAHAEGHASMRVLTATSADLAPANWKTLAGGATSDTSTITSTKSAPVTVLTPAYASKMALATYRKRAGTHAKDLYLFWQDQNAAGSLRASRCAWNGGTGWFAASITPVVLAANVRGGSTTIRQLWEVISKPAEDTANDRVYVGFANYKDNTSGDTWSVSGLSNADAALAVTDAYSCGGTFTPSLYALTGDIAYDTTASRLVVAYIHSGGVGFNGAYAKLYDGSTLGGETTLFTTADVDIPLLYAEPRTGATRVNSKLFCVFRDTRNQAAPYFGWTGTIALA